MGLKGPQGSKMDAQVPVQVSMIRGFWGWGMGGLSKPGSIHVYFSDNSVCTVVEACPRAEIAYRGRVKGKSGGMGYQRDPRESPLVCGGAF